MRLLLPASIILTASTVYVPIHRRFDSCYDPTDGDVADAGIGAEFESMEFTLGNPKCSADDTNAAKGKVIAGRTGTNWMLTAESGEDAGKLRTEYILDGKSIKIGSGDAAKAGAAAAKDLIDWQPWKNDPPNEADVADSNCNPWTITGPKQSKDGAKLIWGSQVTAPMPFEGIYDILEIHQTFEFGGKEESVLDGGTTAQVDATAFVTDDLFESTPNGIAKSKVTKDVLGFCSMVLSYAKGAKNKLQPDESPKSRVSIMPRTEFNTLYEQVKSKIPGDLFELLKVLACYTNDAIKDDKDKTDGTFKVIIDKDFCTGTTAEPVPGKQFEGLSYTNKDGDTVNIKDWITGIGSQSPSPDLLTKFDKTIDGSIGGLGTALEKMYKSDRKVPIFEFRGLDTIPTTEFESFMHKADTAVQEPHEKYPDAPQEKRKKRATPITCQLSSSPPTSTASPTAKPTQGCQSPDHNGLVSFTFDEGRAASADFVTQCQGVELKPGGPSGCVLYFDPLGKSNDDAGNVNVAMFVQQTEWSSGTTSTFPDSQEMTDTLLAIMESCDKSSTTEKWGGFKSVTVDAGMRMYNMSATTDGKYPTPSGFHVA